MNRRDLLKLFAFVPALALIRESDAAEELDEEALEVEPSGIFYEGPDLVVAAIGEGKADTHKWAHLLIKRVSGVPLIKLDLSTYGGYVRWIPALGEEIVSIPGHEVLIERSCPEIDAHLLIKKRGINVYDVLHAP